LVLFVAEALFQLSNVDQELGICKFELLEFILVF